jgi:hypothetical protein
VGISVCANSLFCPTATTGSFVVLKCWYKTRSGFKHRGFADDIPDWLAKVLPRREHGSTTLVASFGGGGPQGLRSREDQAGVPMPWTTD